jgi:hypothetical protein
MDFQSTLAKSFQQNPRIRPTRFSQDPKKMPDRVLITVGFNVAGKKGEGGDDSTPGTHE